jgi:hypothetical protein
MSVIRGKFINPNQAIKQNADPFAPEDVARKLYVDNGLAAVNKVPHKEAKILTLTDISNGYINLTRLAIVESTVVNLGGIEQHENDDYTVSTVGQVTRITFIGTLLASLVPGDTIYIRYWSLT